MYLLSTTLFINGLPVEYFLNKENEVYEFTPFFNPHEDLNPPHFFLQKQGEAWVVEESIEPSVYDQAIETVMDYLKDSEF